MSVNSYLNNLADNLIIRNDEKESIRRSFLALENRLNLYFEDRIEFVKEFGSYQRNTILPREYDINSDIDVMVKFIDTSYHPQTYLNFLRKFSELKYSRSEIYQSNPTIVLELNHIRFELVPCIATEWYENGNYKIPSKANDYQKWLLTSPFDFDEELTRKNKVHNFQIKRLIRIMKLWNKNNEVYNSFELEEMVVKYNFFGENSLKGYFYDFVTSLSEDNLVYQYQKEKLKKLIEKVREVQQYENQYPDWAENELRNIFE